MPAISDVEGLAVVDPEGRELAVVEHVLFHPSEPRAVALQILQPALAVVVTRKPRYLALTPGLLEGWREAQHLKWTARKLPSQAAVEKEIGAVIDCTVIWRGMEVKLETGERVGEVSDAVFSRKTGAVLRMELSAGSLADFAVGRTVVPGELIEGFDGTAVIVSPGFRTLPASGGVAAAAGMGAAYAKAGADKAADAVAAAGVAGLGMLERSFRSGLGRKAIRGLRRAGKRVRKTIDGDEG
jgi:uncharacterized protein YrrD